MPDAPLGPAYRIVAPRLLIRCFAPADARLVKAAIDANLDHLRTWIPWARSEPKPLAHKIQQLREFRGRFDLNVDWRYGMFTPDEATLVGGIGVHARSESGAREIGYWVQAAYQGRGLATEAVAALVRVCFEIDGVRRIEARIEPPNQRSAALVQRLGFRCDATLRQCLCDDQERWHDADVWTLLAAEYPHSPAAHVPVAAFDVVGQPLLLRPVGKRHA